MPDPSPVQIPKDALPTLRHLSDLLHLFHHRNKNQHRLGIWYRHFATFRRQLNHLIHDLSSLHTSPATHLERARQKTREPAIQARVARRVGFWREVGVAKWQRAFSQVVADGRFAALGVVLVAVLAQACWVVGVTEGLEEEGRREVERVLEEFGQDAWGRRGEPESEGEDAGFVVERDGAGGQAGGAEEEAPVVEVERTQKAVPKAAVGVTEKKAKRAGSESAVKPVKKKRKKGDAIDDLFSGL